jgi:AraC-like DNA-binding protein
MIAARSSLRYRQADADARHAAERARGTASRDEKSQRIAATPIAFVHAMLRAYEKYGVDPGRALQEAQIPPSLLRHPDARITAAQMEVFSGLAMQQLDDEALGWFSRKLPWGSYGMLCRASLTAPNLGVALKRWCRHHRLLTDDIVLDLTIAGGVARLSINENRRLREMREFCLLTSLRYVHGYACWAVDSLIALREVAFPLPPPPHHDVYPLLFPGPVYFNAPRAEFTFDAQYLALGLRRDERALQTMLQRALPLTVRQYRRDRLLVQHLRELLRTRGAELSNAEAVAGALNVSPRTLHRQLQEEGASLQALKDEVRRERAIEQLLRTTRSVKQIARDVGFRNEKSFTRAFRQWTGHSPIEYRSKADAA